MRDPTAFVAGFIAFLTLLIIVERKVLTALRLGKEVWREICGLKKIASSNIIESNPINIRTA